MNFEVDVCEQEKSHVVSINKYLKKMIKVSLPCWCYLFLGRFLLHQFGGKSDYIFCWISIRKEPKLLSPTFKKMLIALTWMKIFLSR